MAQECLRQDPAAAESLLEGVGQDLKLALEELQELARGLHPAILTDRGTRPRPTVAREPCTFPGRDHRGGPCTPSRGSRGRHLLRRRRKPDERRETLRRLGSLRHALIDSRQSQRRDPGQRQRWCRSEQGHRSARTRRPGRGPRWNTSARKRAWPRNGRPGRAAAPLSELDARASPRTPARAPALPDLIPTMVRMCV